MGLPSCRPNLREKTLDPSFRHVPDTGQGQDQPVEGIGAWKERESAQTRLSTDVELQVAIAEKASDEGPVIGGVQHARQGNAMDSARQDALDGARFWTLRK